MLCPLVPPLSKTWGRGTCPRQLSGAGANGCNRLLDTATSSCLNNRPFLVDCAKLLTPNSPKTGFHPTWKLRLPNYQNGSDGSCLVGEGIVAFVSNRRRCTHNEPRRRLPLANLQRQQKHLYRPRAADWNCQHGRSVTTVTTEPTMRGAEGSRGLCRCEKEIVALGPTSVTQLYEGRRRGAGGIWCFLQRAGRNLKLATVKFRQY